MRTIILGGLMLGLLVCGLNAVEIMTVWHDDLQNAAAGGNPRNYWGCSLQEDGDGYITIAVASNGTFNTMLSPGIEVLAGDILTYQFSGTTAPYNVQPQMYISGTYYTFEGTITYTTNGTVYTKQYIMPASGTLTQVNMKSNWSSNEVITYYDFIITRKLYPAGYLWQDTLDESADRGYYNTTLVEDGDGYVEFEVANDNATFATFGTPFDMPVTVAAGDVFVATYAVSRLPGDDLRFQDIFLMLNLNGSWKTVRAGGGDIGDTELHYLTYEFAAAASLSNIYFKAAWGYDASLPGRVKVYDYAVLRSAPKSCAELQAQNLGEFGDLDGDCRVDLIDFSAFAYLWLVDYHPVP